MDHDGKKKPARPGEVPIDRFREAGYRAVDWIGDYLEKTREYAVLPDCAEGDLLARLPEEMPEEGESFEAIEKDFRERIVPAVTHWNHPRFFAYFSITGSAPGILGELYSAALNTNGMKWASCPASVELEKRVLQWLARAVGLPGDFSGIVVDLASTATLLSLAVARERACGFRSRKEGFDAKREKLVLYTSRESHVSVEKAAIVLGLGLDAVHAVDTDDEYRLDPAALSAAIDADRAAGRKPFAVVATLGTTVTTSVDPAGAIADIARREQLWFHVDAAYAGPAAMLPEKRLLFDGWERADSIVFNPHKWLFVPIDASALFFRDPRAWRHAFSVVPDYLASDGDADDPMDYGFQLGRRFRALKLWFVLRTYGRRGLVANIRHHIALAADLAGRIDRSARWERVAPVHFSTVCFRFTGGGEGESSDRANREIFDRLNRSGIAHISRAVVGGRFVLRLTFGNLKTTGADVDEVWRALEEMAGRS